MEGSIINDRLLAKMENEQNAFLSAMIDAEPIEALSMSRRYHVQETLLQALRQKPLAEQQALALLRCTRPLAAVYHHWERKRLRQQSLFYDMLVEYANHILWLRELSAEGKHEGDT